MSSRWIRRQQTTSRSRPRTDRSNHASNAVNARSRCWLSLYLVPSPIKRNNKKKNQTDDMSSVIAQNHVARVWRAAGRMSANICAQTKTASRSARQTRLIRCGRSWIDSSEDGMISSRRRQQQRQHHRRGRVVVVVRLMQLQPWRLWRNIIMHRVVVVMMMNLRGHGKRKRGQKVVLLLSL